MMTLRLAFRLAFSRDPRQRWRQVSVSVAVFLATFVALAGCAVVNACREGDVHHRARAFVNSSSARSAMQWSMTMPTLQDQQFPVFWISAAPGAPVPPGLNAYPPAGHVVLSPGLVDAGVTAAQLGMSEALVGTGPGGRIGAAGLRAMSEPVAYATLPRGKKLPRAQGASGYGVGTDAEADAIDPFRPLPSATEALVAVLWALTAPAIYLIAGASRATSAVRAERARTLYRWGIRPSRVRLLLGLEAALLGVPSALLGALAWWMVSRATSSVVGTHTELLPGSLVLPTEVLAVIVASVLLILGCCGCAFRVVDKHGVLSGRTPGAWSLIPFLVSLAMMGGSILLDARSPARIPVLFGGLLLGLGAIPLCLPRLVTGLGRLLGRSERKIRWLAGRRLQYRSMSLSRPAAATAALVFIAGSAFALYERIDHRNPIAQSPHAVVGFELYWNDPHSGDEHLIRTAFPEGVVLTQRGSGYTIRDCHDFARLSSMTGRASGSCVPGRALSAEQAKLLADDVGAPVSVSAVAEPSSHVIVATTERLTVFDVLTRVGSRLLMPEVEMRPDSARSSGTTGAWVFTAWATACVLLGLALLRDVLDRVFVSLREDDVPRRQGVSERDMAAVQRWSVLPPLLIAIPLGVTSSVVFALVGNQLGVTTDRVARIVGVGACVAVVASLAITALLAAQRSRPWQSVGGGE